MSCFTRLRNMYQDQPKLFNIKWKTLYMILPIGKTLLSTAPDTTFSEKIPIQGSVDLMV